MSLGNPEPGISHEVFLGYCPFCMQRGINNWTELKSFGDITCCGSCKTFLKGQLEHDIPDLKLYVKDMGKAPKTQSQVPQAPAPRVPVLSETPLIPSSESAEHAQWLANHHDMRLRKEMADAILSDPDSMFQILTDPRFFSLKELRRHAERLKKPLDDLPMEAVLAKRVGRPPANPVIAEERKRITINKANLKFKRKKRLEEKCRLNQNQETQEKQKLTSPSNTEKAPQGKAAVTSPIFPELTEKVSVQVTPSLEKAHLNDSRNSAIKKADNSGDQYV